MATEAIISEAGSQMEKACEFLVKEFRGVRTGRATPGLVDGLRVEVASYGSTMTVKELGNVAVADGNVLVIKPYDPSVLKDIERAIVKSELGINPQNDGKVLRLPVPALSTERRNQLVQRVKQLAEQQKVSVRNLRRDANKAIEGALKDKSITEDDSKAAQDKVQKLTDDHIKRIDDLAAEKTKDIMEV